MPRIEVEIKEDGTVLLKWDERVIAVASHEAGRKTVLSYEFS